LIRCWLLKPSLRKEVWKARVLFCGIFSQAMTAKVQWVPEHAVTDFLG
jgi:hypothetical protein